MFKKNWNVVDFIDKAENKILAFVIFVLYLPLSLPDICFTVWCSLDSTVFLVWRDCSISTGDLCDGDIPVPHFKRRKQESEKAYVRRMENETKHVLFLSKNQVERRPEQDADEEKPGSKSKSEKKKECVFRTAVFLEKQPLL